jgi:hypothetical protein
MVETRKYFWASPEVQINQGDATTKYFENLFRRQKIARREERKEMD